MVCRADLLFLIYRGRAYSKLNHARQYVVTVIVQTSEKAERFEV